MIKKGWFVVKEVRAWEWVEDLDMFCWVEKTHERITKNRETKEEADNDFTELGFNTNTKTIVQCQDEIKLNKTWIRHIVQYGRV